MPSIDLTALPDMELFDDEPVFNEPWEAQAFAMAVNLHQNGAFSWTEWADALSSEIHGPEQRSYYQHWLFALEGLVAAKNLTTSKDLATRKREWHDAADSTPHGKPIVLMPKASN